MDLHFYFILFFVIYIDAQEVDINSETKVDSKASKKKTEVLPPCQACKMLANSFKKGIERTSRGKFEGGDASWEKSRLKSYAESEIRLVEIQEKLCIDEEKAAEQCHRLAEEHESLLEEWWFKKKNSFPDIFYYLCIDKLQVCCPENHYGPDCKPCVGGIVNPCNNHGQCKGGGTRKGSGLCRCDPGYIGEFCDQCKIGYFNESSGDSWQCLKCDKSCKAHCRKGGPRGCEVCATGYQYSVELGCIDVNECVELSSDPCKLGTFCVNSIGSYRCVACDKSCDGCTGDGPDMCIKCASGYTYEDPLCIEIKTWRRSLYIEVTRYGTYLGLCVATFIIFRRHMFIASIIGIFVAVYIGLSEYTVGEWDKRSLIKSIKSLIVL
ncbi:cysteine-rich with EGF-like domain protein 2 [Parasteatoda tepidariorum]|uniref:cysteine-rich with EGF-like domain protein 2 n=1 Tax=Parasteatoda tepidariorum TaxID=114398 RepID=UPI00077FCBA2|nr:cysteine-rich with EGF-like domain protein 2 [Parasteatoda tepidariorum]XP_015916836.1 cysteine-rich with EGF-like domain protein 2 [Parasteatoda tepidariorum]